MVKSGYKRQRIFSGKLGEIKSNREAF